MTVIELGEVSSSPGEDPGERPGPRLTRRLVRQLTLTVLAMLTVVGVTGSTVPEPRGVRPLWSVPADEGNGTAVTDDTAYLSVNTDSRGRLTAYALATGAVRWTVELPDPITYLQAVPATGLVLLPTDRDAVALAPGDAQATTSEFHRETTALDARTGAVRWRAPGQPNAYSRDTVLLEELGDDGRLARVRLVRLADGGTVWTRATPGVVSQTRALRNAEPERLITVTASGQVTVYRYADGEVLTRARIPWVRPRAEEGYYNDLSAENGFLVVNQARQETIDLDVYRIDTMEKTWRAENTGGFASFCGGQRLCLYDRGIAARDSATGRELWSLGSGGHLWRITDDRLLLDDGTDDGFPTLLDAATGSALGSGGRGAPVYTDEPTDVLLLLRPTVDPPHRSSVTRWNVRTGEQRLLGSVDLQADRGCQSRARYLICQSNGRLQVLAVA